MTPNSKEIEHSGAADLADATRQLMFSMRRALVERRQVVELGEFKFRFQRRGEVFEDEHGAYKALESGVFAYFRATAGGLQVPGRWLHHGSTDDLESMMAPYIKNMGLQQIREAHVLISANAALQSLRDEQAGGKSTAPRNRRNSP